ncbi:hypothetical protein FSW04_04620 [Baekduia soli]|uniref:Uncharacterized protein n=1 Tax=Baekduia soli TaxID=496014 RepID=A0A5B8U1I9_9ACTN|nr:hypothetical protein [Baekduia soli]QEC46944.1 hypothetical protein FSW04_04620 [Baekduia soli]
MDGVPLILLVALAASVPAMLAQELARAAAALLLTRGRVCVLLGAGRPVFAVRLGRLVVGPTRRWLWGGECLHAPSVSRRRATAILLAGPLTGDACFALAAALALSWRGAATHHPHEQVALWVFALVALARASLDLARLRGRWPGAADAAR